MTTGGGRRLVEVPELEVDGQLTADPLTKEHPMRFTVRRTCCALLGAATLASYGCSNAPTGPATGGTGRPTIRVQVVRTGASASALFRSRAMRAVSGVPVGEATPERLEYFLTSLALCESLTTTGTAFSNPRGLVELYGNRSVNYDTYDFNAARNDPVAGHYMDLLDPNTLGVLQQTVMLPPGMHRFNWALATWNRPVKVQAAVPLGDGTWLYTKDGDEVTQGGSRYTNVTADMTSGPAELGLVDLNNGGTWFKLQNPITIPDSAGTFTLSLVFNPDRLIKASANGASNYPMRDSLNRGIYTPILDLTPVLHSTSASVQKETFVLTGAPEFDIRLELYSLVSDSTRTIMGAAIKSLYTVATTQNVMHPLGVSFIHTADDGSLTFSAWDDSPILTGFTRATGGGTATFYCQNAFSGLDLCGGAASVNLTYASPEVTILP